MLSALLSTAAALSGAGADKIARHVRESAQHRNNVVTVTRIDRPARSTFDLFAIVKQIVDAMLGLWGGARRPVTDYAPQ